MANHTELSTPVRIIGRPFRKGISGNPGGKPKSVRLAEKALRSLLPRALKVLEDLLLEDDPNIRRDAAKMLLQYTIATADKQFDRFLRNQNPEMKEPELDLETARALAFQKLDG